MPTRYKTNVMLAGGLGSLMLSLALLLIVVLPATQLGRVTTEAQPQVPAPPGGAAGAPRMGAMGPPMGMGGQMGTMGMGMAAAPAPAPAQNIFHGDPFESSRPNPFSSTVAKAVGVGTKYGPNWAQMPLASRVGIASAQRAPEPEAMAAPEVGEIKFMRISSIMWTGGRPLAVYEMRDGKTGSVRPGDIVDDWRVEQIGQDYVKVSNVVSGEVRRALLKSK